MPGKTKGACLVANEPDGLGQKMLEMRIQGKSWKEIADTFGLGSPGTARKQFTKLTGITDYKSKGPALKQIAENLKQMQQGQAAQSVSAVKKVDDALKPPVVEEAWGYYSKLKSKDVEVRYLAEFDNDIQAWRVKIIYEGVPQKPLSKTFKSAEEAIEYGKLQWFLPPDAHKINLSNKVANIASTPLSPPATVNAPVEKVFKFVDDDGKDVFYKLVAKYDENTFEWEATFYLNGEIQPYSALASTPEGAINTLKGVLGIPQDLPSQDVLAAATKAVTGSNASTGEIAVANAKKLNSAFNVDKVKNQLDNVVSDLKSVYGADKVDTAVAMLRNKNGYLSVQQKTGLPIKDIDTLNWKMLKTESTDLWDAYKKKPSSQSGFNEVVDSVTKMRGAGMTKAEVSNVTRVPENIIDGIEQGTWKIAGPGQTTPNVPPPPPEPPAVVEISGPTKLRQNYRAKKEWDAWHQQLGNDLTGEQYEAVRAYTGSAYRGINTGLRNNPGRVPDYIKNYVKNIDDAMRPLPFDVTVTRQVGIESFSGLGIKSPNDFKKLIGKVFHDDGYLSTSYAKEGTWSGPVKMRISAPQGHKARYVDLISMNKGEKEVILARGTKMMVTKVEVTGNTAFGADKVILHCEVI